MFGLAENKKLSMSFMEAARLRLSLEHILEDSNYEAVRGGEIYLAIDNDIIVLHTLRPADTVKRYMKMFSDDPEDSLSALATRITDDLFYGEYAKKILILSWHREEFIESLGAAISKKIVEWRSLRNEVTSLPAEFKDMLENDADEEWSDEKIRRFVENLKRHSPKLHDYLFGHAVSDLRLMRKFADNALDSNKSILEDLREPVRAVLSRHSGRRLADDPLCADEWFDRIRREKSGYKSSASIFNDAEALAFVLACNFHWQNQGMYKRLYLVTGDDGLRMAFDTAYFDDQILDNFPHVVRHPRELMPFFRSLTDRGHATAARTIEALDCFLGVPSHGAGLPMQPAGIRYMQALHKFVKTESLKELAAIRPVDHPIAFPSDIRANMAVDLVRLKEKWGHAVRLSVFANMDAEREITKAKFQSIRKILASQKVKKVILEGLEDGIHGLGTLYGQLSFLTSPGNAPGPNNLSAVNFAAYMAIRISREGLAKIKEGNWRRVPCALRFDCPLADDYVSAMSRDIDPELMDEIRDIIKKIPINVLNLANAFIAFAYENWEESNRHCRNVLVDTQNADSAINAEALYLMGVLQRFNAVTPQDMVHAISLLDDAERERKKSVPGDESDLRIYAEKGTSIIYIYDILATTHGVEDRAAAQDGFPSLASGVSILKRARIMLEGGMGLDGEPVRTKVATQVYANLCSTYLYWKLKFYEGFGDVDLTEAEYKACLDRLRAVVAAAGGEKLVSPYVNFVLYLGDYVELLESGGNDTRRGEIVRAMESVWGTERPATADEEKTQTARFAKADDLEIRWVLTWMNEEERKRRTGVPTIVPTTHGL